MNGVPGPLKDVVSAGAIAGRGRHPRLSSRSRRPAVQPARIEWLLPALAVNRQFCQFLPFAKVGSRAVSYGSMPSTETSLAELHSSPQP